MKLLLISCSQNAYVLSGKLEELLKKEMDCEIISGVKCNALPYVSMEESIKEFVGKWFYQVDAILFICATGIAVRSIAPYLTHKSKDPGVLVMDERGKYCISLLSGHMGGGNLLTEKIARMVNAIPVITTATDIENKFSVDTFAKEWDLTIENWNLAKQVSVAVLEEKPIGFISYNAGDEAGISLIKQLEGALMDKAQGAVKKDAPGDINLSIDYRMKTGHDNNCLCLIPKVLALGIGCKKNTSLEQVRIAVRKSFQENNLYEAAIFKLASIDLKKEEPALIAFCHERKIPFITFSSEELLEVKGDFASSSFVESVTGVDNVCERSALAACGECGGRILVKKTVYDGVTIAVAIGEII